MLNHIDIQGRMACDPELRRTGTGIAVTSFTVAVDRDYSPKDGGERETDFSTASPGVLLESSSPSISPRTATSVALLKSWQTMSTSAKASVPSSVPAATMPRRPATAAIPIPTLLRRRILRCWKVATNNFRSSGESP